MENSKADSSVNQDRQPSEQTTLSLTKSMLVGSLALHSFGWPGWNYDPEAAACLDPRVRSWFVQPAGGMVPSTNAHIRQTRGERREDRRDLKLLTGETTLYAEQVIIAAKPTHPGLVGKIGHFLGGGQRTRDAAS